MLVRKRERVYMCVHVTLLRLRAAGSFHFSTGAGDRRERGREGETSEVLPSGEQTQTQTQTTLRCIA